MKVGDLVKETAFDLQVCLIIKKHTDSVFKVIYVSGEIEAIHKDYLEVLSESR
tara:strand:+ start:48529 stop:48687 length:159 start_codon:yes stop_codon:yes gene_type:complete